jgi:hypothetical protein
LTAIGPGTTQLEARRLRPWEGESSVVERFSCTVEVRAKRSGASAAERDAKMP